MAKVTPTETLYCGLLESLDVEIASKNATLLYAYEDDGSAGPIRVDGKELVIPNKVNQKQSVKFWEKRVAFHPLTEQALRGESKVFRTLQSLINWKIIKTLSFISYNLTLIASHPEIPKKLNPKQHVLLDALIDANKKTVKFVKDISAASFSGGQSSRLIKTFIKRGGHYHGKKHSAVLITTFSLFENDNIDRDKRTILGVKAPRITDMDAIPDLFKLILPKCDVIGGEYYNAASNDETAPRLHALLTGYSKIANRLNTVLETYGSFIEDYEDHLIDLDWTEKLDDFEKIRHNIPPMEDNYGDSEKSTKEDIRTSKKLSSGDNTDELERTSQHVTTKTQSNKSTNTNLFKNVDPKNSDERKGQHKTQSNARRSKKKMSIDPMMMMQMMNNNSNGNKSTGDNKKSSFDPMTLMAMGGDIDPMTMMMMNQGGEMDIKTLMMMNAMKGDNNDMNPLLMSQMMGGDIDPMMLMAMGGGDIDPMMLMMMNQNKDDGDSKIDPMMLMMMMNQNKGDGDNKMNPLLMSQLMGGDSDIDPMMLMAMSGGDIDPMMLMMMNQNKDDGDSKLDPMMLMMMNQNKGDGDNKMNPLLMSQLMGGDIDPMMLMAMSGGDIDPMTMMMLSQNKKAKKGETVTPKQPTPNKPSYPKA